MLDFYWTNRTFLLDFYWTNRTFLLDFYWTNRNQYTTFHIETNRSVGSIGNFLLDFRPGMSLFATTDLLIALYFIFRYNHQQRRDQTKMLEQGLRLPDAPLASSLPLPPPATLPVFTTPTTCPHTVSRPSDTAGSVAPKMRKLQPIAPTPSISTQPICPIQGYAKWIFSTNSKFPYVLYTNPENSHILSRRSIT